ncbi:MAG: hypothetical protein ACUVRE_08275 [Thermoanaerobaculaceae bacterium]
MNLQPLMGIGTATAVAFFFACGLGSQPLGERAAEPHAFTLVLGQGGGFTGAQEGYRINFQGKVERWHRLPGKPASYQEIGTLSQEQLRELTAALEALDLANLPAGAPGNFSSFLEITISQSTHSTVWSGGYQEAPKSLRPLLQLLLGWIAKLE